MKSHVQLVGLIALMSVAPCLRSEELIDFAAFGLHRSLVLETTDYDLYNVGPLGDLDGDGFNDLAVGTIPRVDGEPILVDLLLGSSFAPGRLALEAAPFRKIRLISHAEGDLNYLQFQSAGVGDIDRDGATDAVFGFEGLKLSPTSRGVAYLILGGRELPHTSLVLEDIGVTVPGCRFTSEDPSQRGVGYAVTGITDFNGDGNNDLAISAPFSPSEQDRTEDMDLRGQVFVLFGGPHLQGELELNRLIEQGQGVKIEGFSRLQEDGSIGGSFGLEVIDLHDINGDGLSDIALGDNQDTCIVLGTESPSTLIDLGDTLDGAIQDGVILLKSPDYETTRLRLGDVASLGDLDGDGLSDFAVGMAKPFLNPRYSHVGRVYLLRGQRELPHTIDFNTIPIAEAVTSIFGVESEGLFGALVMSPGDINGDGIRDLGIATRGFALSGDLAILYGQNSFGAEVFLQEPYEGVFLKGEAPDDRFATDGPIAAGDVNGDGIEDLVAMSRHPFPLENNTYADRIYVVLGESSGTDRPIIYAVEPSAGVQRGGTTVRILGKGFTPDTSVRFEGRSLSSVVVKSQYEVEGVTPPGVALGNVSVEATNILGVGVLRDGFEYTQDIPIYHVQDLGSNGLVLDGDTGTPGSKAFTWISASAMVFDDVNGDGVDDLVIESTAPDGWFVTVVKGRPKLAGTLPAYEPSSDVVVIREGENHYGTTGASGCNVVSLGDVNADGLEDLGIGVWYGLGFILFGGTELLNQPTVVIEQEIEAGRASRIDLGGGIESGQVNFCKMGDLDRDGVVEFAVMHSYNGGEIRIAEVASEWFDFMGDFGDWTVSTFRCSEPGLRIGGSMMNAGDVDGDSIDDFVLRAEVDAGASVAFLIFGRDRFPESVDIPQWVQAGGGVRITFTDGSAVPRHMNLSEGGDIDGDGYRDLLIGIPMAGELTTQGLSYVVFGRADFPSTVNLSTLSMPSGVVQVMGEGPMEQAGQVGPAGDFNADGFDDFVIGSPGFQSSQESGNVFVVFGGDGLPPRIELRQLGGRGFKIDGQNVPGGAGFFVGPSGDLNADGQPDFAFTEIGSPLSVARVYVIYGPHASKEFSRGDANADQRLDITDAISVLNYLFSGGEPPLCLDAADADDDAVLTITDPIKVLSYLFLGAQDLPSPFPGQGFDPTEDGLSCLLF